MRLLPGQGLCDEPGCLGALAFVKAACLSATCGPRPVPGSCCPPGPACWFSSNTTTYLGSLHQQPLAFSLLASACALAFNLLTSACRFLVIFQGVSLFSRKRSGFEGKKATSSPSLQRELDSGVCFCQWHTGIGLFFFVSQVPREGTGLTRLKFKIH